MNSRLSARLAILAAGLCLPAAAHAGSRACPGDDSMPDSARGTTVIRSGSGHSHLVVQNDPDGSVRLEQHGEDHVALAVQSGDGSRLAIDQRGVSAEAEVAQDGTCNAAELAQTGERNRATVSQRGTGNRAVVRQGPRGE